MEVIEAVRAPHFRHWMPCQIERPCMINGLCVISLWTVSAVVEDASCIYIAVQLESQVVLFTSLLFPCLLLKYIFQTVIVQPLYIFNIQVHYKNR